MADKPAGKPSLLRAIDTIKPADKNKADTGEDRGARVFGFQDLFYPLYLPGISP